MALRLGKQDTQPKLSVTYLSKKTRHARTFGQQHAAVRSHAYVHSIVRASPACALPDLICSNSTQLSTFLASSLPIQTHQIVQWLAATDPGIYPESTFWGISHAERGDGWFDERCFRVLRGPDRTKCVFQRLTGRLESPPLTTPKVKSPHQIARSVWYFVLRTYFLPGFET